MARARVSASGKRATLMAIVRLTESSSICDVATMMPSLLSIFRRLQRPSVHQLTITARDAMSIVRVNCFGISLDGFAAGPDQDLEHPLGHGGEVLHEWQFQSRHFREMLGMDGGETGIDDDFVV